MTGRAFGALPPEREYLVLNRYDLQRLADLRAAEARLLLDNGYWSGAYYLAGYAVECGLKACIARRVREFDFPIWTGCGTAITMISGG